MKRFLIVLFLFANTTWSQELKVDALQSELIAFAQSIDVKSAGKLWKKNNKAWFKQVETCSDDVCLREHLVHIAEWFEITDLGSETSGILSLASGLEALYAQFNKEITSLNLDELQQNIRIAKLNHLKAIYKDQSDRECAAFLADFKKGFPNWLAAAKNRFTTLKKTAKVSSANPKQLITSVVCGKSLGVLIKRGDVECLLISFKLIIPEDQGEVLKEKLMESIKQEMPSGYVRRRDHTGIGKFGSSACYEFEGEKFADGAKHPTVCLGTVQTNPSEFSIVINFEEPILK